MGGIGFFLFKRNRRPFVHDKLAATSHVRVQWSVSTHALGGLVAGTF
jgi:hypothetical protein